MDTKTVFSILARQRSPHTLELLHIRIASPQWFGNDLYVQERLRRPHALFTTRILQVACMKTHRQIMNAIVSMAKCILSQLFGPDVPAMGVSKPARGVFAVVG